MGHDSFNRWISTSLNIGGDGLKSNLVDKENIIPLLSNILSEVSHLFDLSIVWKNHIVFVSFGQFLGRMKLLSTKSANRPIPKGSANNFPKLRQEALNKPTI